MSHEAEGRLGVRDVAGTLWRLRVVDPTVVAATVGALALTGPTAAAPYVAAAIRTPRRTAIVDEYGSITYRELDQRTGSYGAALEARGLTSAARVGILCRNHRGFVTVIVSGTLLPSTCNLKAGRVRCS